MHVPLLGEPSDSCTVTSNHSYALVNFNFEQLSVLHIFNSSPQSVRKLRMEKSLQ